MTRIAFIRSGRVTATAATASLAFALSLSVSHDAMAACTGSVAAPASTTTSLNTASPPLLTRTTISVQCGGVGTAGAGTAGLPYVVGPAGTLIDNSTNTIHSNNTLLQFDGHGRVLDNSGQISNDRVMNGPAVTGETNARGRTAITMGASTQNAGAGTSYTVGTYNSGSNTTVITVDGTTVSTALVGQSIVLGRFDGGDNDFYPGTAFEITDVSGSTVTVRGQVASGASGTGSFPERYSIVSNYGATTVVGGVAYNDVVFNRAGGVISASIGAAEINATKTGTTSFASVSNTSNVRAINTSVAGTYLIKNDAGGKISATHAGIGLVQAIFEGGQVLSMTVDNAGLIDITRQAPLSLVSVTATGNPTATSSSFSGFSAQAIGNAWTIATEEEAEEVIVNNRVGGVIRSTGDYTGTIYSRVEEASIVNRGLIEHLSGSGDADDYSKGFAIGQVSNGGGVRELEIENYGTIHGDILSVNGMAVRWYLLSTEGVVTTNSSGTTSDLAAGLDQRLLINSHNGQANSEIENKSTGTIIGNFWYSNGNHELENEGKIVGNIDVDQRDTTYANGGNVGSSLVLLPGSDEDIDPETDRPRASNNTAQGTNYRIRGDKKFEFENEGKFTGNLTIRNATSAFSGATYGTETVDKTVSSDNKIENSGTFDGNITIHDVAGAKNEITLSGDGFGRKADGTVNTATGNITAVNGTGSNVLNLDGQGTLRGDVLKFTTLNVLAGAPVEEEEDEEDDEDDEASAPGGTIWTLAATKTFQFQNVNILGTLNVRGNLFGNTEIEEGGVLTGKGTITGNVKNEGKIDLDDDTLKVVGNVSFRAGSTLATLIGDDENGLLSVTGTTTFIATSTVEAGVDDGARVRNGDSYKIVSTTGGITGLPDVEDTSALLHWTPILDGGNLYITADVTTDHITGLSNPAVAAINALLDSDNELGNDLLLIKDEDDVRKAGEQLKPETNFATQQAAIVLNQATGQHIDARLASVGATGTSGSFAQPSGLGMAQKSDPNRSSLGGPTSSVGPATAQGGSALWGRAFGVGFNQGEIDSVDGYDARLYGILTGYDNWVSPGLRLGVALGYANTSIDGTGDTKSNQTGIDSYLAELYGSYKGSGWYATGRTGFTWHDYDTTRVLNAGGVTDVAKGGHDGQQYNAALEVGAPMRVSNGSVLTPVASLTYSNLRQDGYTETSSGGMALSVDDQDNDSLVSGLGLKALFPIASDTVLEARALWLHEFSDNAQDVQANFAGGGATFTAAGPDVGRDSAALGVGLMAVIGPESTFQLNYDANIREDYVAHIGSAELTVRY